MNSTRAVCYIQAPRERVYRALLDPRAIEQWKVPDNMRCQVHSCDPRVQGALRVSLHYNTSDSAGKSTARTDTYRGRFLELIVNERLVEADEFETADPALQGEMLTTITLQDSGTGTELVAVHEHLPPAVSVADNEQGWRMALAKLAALVESERNA